MKRFWLTTTALIFLILPFYVIAEAPTVSSVRVGVSANGPNVSPLNLIPNSNATYYVNGTVSDTDGFNDILSVSVVFYRSDITNGADCSSDKNNCYRPSNCNLSNGDGNNIDYSCQINVAYFADPTDSGNYTSETWKVRVRVTDTSLSVDDSNYNNELQSMLAIASTPSTINYGSLDLGQTSNSIRLDVVNSGNVPADSSIFSSGNMTCTLGSILVANQKYGRSDVDFTSLEYTLSTTPNYATLSLPAQTDDATVINDELYFRIKAPNVGVSGTCAGTININAISPQV